MVIEIFDGGKIISLSTNIKRLGNIPCYHIKVTNFGNESIYKVNILPITNIRLKFDRDSSVIDRINPGEIVDIKFYFRDIIGDYFDPNIRLNTQVVFIDEKLQKFLTESSSIKYHFANHHFIYNPEFNKNFNALSYIERSIDVENPQILNVSEVVNLIRSFYRKRILWVMDNIQNSNLSKNNYSRIVIRLELGCLLFFDICLEPKQRNINVDIWTNDLKLEDVNQEIHEIKDYIASKSYRDEHIERLRLQQYSAFILGKKTTLLLDYLEVDWRISDIISILDDINYEVKKFEDTFSGIETQSLKWVKLLKELNNISELSNSQKEHFLNSIQSWQQMIERSLRQ